MQEVTVEDSLCQGASRSGYLAEIVVHQVAGEQTQKSLVSEIQEEFLELEAVRAVTFSQDYEALGHRLRCADFVMVVQPIVKEGAADQHLLERSESGGGNPKL